MHGGELTVLVGMAIVAQAVMRTVKCLYLGLV
jgi:hypothetical protein